MFVHSGRHPVLRQRDEQDRTTFPSPERVLVSSLRAAAGSSKPLMSPPPQERVGSTQDQTMHQNAGAR